MLEDSFRHHKIFLTCYFVRFLKLPVDNYGSLKNESGAILDNYSGTLKNESSATLYNNGTLYNESGATLDNYGTLKNESGAILDLTFHVKCFLQVSNLHKAHVNLTNHAKGLEYQ